MKSVVLTLIMALCMSLHAQQKNKYLDFGAAPSINNALGLGIKAPAGYTGLESNYVDSVSSGNKSTLKVNVFARLTIEKSNTLRYGIGLEFAQYGFKRTVLNPVLGYYKHEDLGKIGSIIASQTALDYYTQMRAVEVPLFLESRIGYPKAGNEQFLYLGVAPMFAWDTKQVFITKGYEEEGKDKFRVNNYRSPGNKFNATASVGYKFIIDIKQPVKIVLMPQLKLPLLPTGGNENYMFTQINLNLGIHFGGKRPTKR